MDNKILMEIARHSLGQHISTLTIPVETVDSYKEKMVAFTNELEGYRAKIKDKETDIEISNYFTEDAIVNRDIEEYIYQIFGVVGEKNKEIRLLREMGAGAYINSLDAAADVTYSIFETMPEVVKEIVKTARQSVEEEFEEDCDACKLLRDGLELVASPFLTKNSLAFKALLNESGMSEVDLLDPKVDEVFNQWKDAELKEVFIKLIANPTEPCMMAEYGKTELEETIKAASEDLYNVLTGMGTCAFNLNLLAHNSASVVIGAMSTETRSTISTAINTYRSNNAMGKMNIGEGEFTVVNMISFASVIAGSILMTGVEVDNEIVTKNAENTEASETDGGINSLSNAVYLLDLMSVILERKGFEFDAYMEIATNMLRVFSKCISLELFTNPMFRLEVREAAVLETNIAKLIEEVVVSEEASLPVAGGGTDV